MKFSIIMFISFLQLLMFSASCFADETASGLLCGARPLPVVDRNFGTNEKPNWNYNRDLVAHNFGLYAAATFDSYANKGDFTFDITQENLKLGWKPLNWNTAVGSANRFEDSSTGLVFDTYYSEGKDCVFVLIAIRGTNFSELNDWYSNLSYFTKILPFQDQYEQIDKQFEKVSDYIKEKFGKKKVQFIATGHSLGGGLSEHLAFCQDNVSAVVFDRSFVYNSFSCKKREPQIVQIFENGELFQKLKKFKEELIGSENNDLSYSRYYLNAMEVPNFDVSLGVNQHSMINLTAGMLRLSLDCLYSKSADRGKGNCEIYKLGVPKNRYYENVLYCEKFRNSKYEDIKKIDANGKVVFERREKDELCDR